MLSSSGLDARLGGGYGKLNSDQSIGAIGGMVGGSMKSEAQSTTQRTFTVVIKFDKNKKVRDYAYRQTAF